MSKEKATNEEKAKAIARFCYLPQSNDDNDLTASFIEDLVLPDTVEEYTLKEIEKYILEYLNRDTQQKVFAMAKKLEYTYEEDEKPRFQMDANGNLTRIE